MSKIIEEKQNVVIKFAGDSGDGMQLVGTQFTNNTASVGHDLGTFPDFPAEIRAPQGTIPGVSGFQIHFGSTEIYTPGDSCDVLVAMNAAALKSNLFNVRKGGILILNTAGFDSRNLKLSGYEVNPLDDDQLSTYLVYKIDITKLTREALLDVEMGVRDKDRSKNMFVLGFIYWLYNREPKNTIQFIERKFKNKEEVIEANTRALKAGYNYGDITEAFSSRFKVKPAKMVPGTYRSITGNPALALGLIAAAKKTGLQLFYGTYPITPASDVLHELAKHKNFGVKTFQAEDEIAAVCSTIGAAFGGNLGITGTSGPGVALKAEAMGLAVMLELPLVILNVQRAGPSTGLPTKTEQSDLLQAVYGRNGECPLPVISASTPSSCFDVAYQAVKIAIEHMTPVMVLTDGYIANGAEPWRFPKSADLQDINVRIIKSKESEEKFMPYLRDENLVRQWAVPGTEGFEHRIGGLEKEENTGNVSYDPENHQKMVLTREEKIERISDFIPEQSIDSGKDKGKVLVLGWGSTFGSIKSAVIELIEEGFEVSHAHITYIKPFPKNLKTLMNQFDKVLIPEINNGQLIKLIRDKYLIDAVGFHKIKGTPITKNELKEEILNIYPNG
ncbi:MAG: 2-oxoacid:acceptor oxidoreductase subunit alpha [Cyclobacteriaceae bacterium]|nr:2-oxoacid:acceptor oxidoreductase subunit alpha [Cyclobacteriaceae bacterium]MCK5370794.1 2-oxoacid:acceptor oxidoreductase subunit alpha [Cyclobacteriaceae bacterium]